MIVLSISIGALAACPGVASAAVTITEASLNNVTSVSSPPGGVFLARVTGVGGPWEGTRFRFGNEQECVHRGGGADNAVVLNDGAAIHGNSILLFADHMSLGTGSSVNAGAGLISFEDPEEDAGSGVLAIGGFCAGGPMTTVNGMSFASISHGYVVFNQASELGSSYRVAPSFTRVLTHEIGRVSFEHVRRDANKHADRLANEAMDDAAEI